MTRTIQISTEQISTEQAASGSLCHVVLANTGRCNALTPDYVAGLTDLLQGFRLAADEAPAAVILSAEADADGGAFFCSGADLADLQAASSGHYAARRAGVDALNGLVRAVRACPCPVIAAVDGGADGAGVALMLACDLIVASEQARFTATQLQAGLTPDAGLTLLLSAGLPRWLVAELLFCGVPLTAPRLHSLGVVNHLAPFGEVAVQARRLADQLVSAPPHALRTTKRLLGQIGRISFDDQLEAEADAAATALGSDEGRARLAETLARSARNKKGAAR